MNKIHMFSTTIEKGGNSKQIYVVEQTMEAAAACVAKQYPGYTLTGISRHGHTIIVGPGCRR